jgi:hypothetical protein
VDQLLALGEFDRAEAVLHNRILPQLRARSSATEEELVGFEGMMSGYVQAVRDRDADALMACCSSAEIGPALFASIGELDRGLDALTRLVAEDPGYGTTFLVTLWVSEWDDVRDDPRFREALRYLNLEGVEPRRAPPGS